MTDGSVVLTGLDGANPLGFLAATGLLRWATEVGGHDARLGWIHEGGYRPVLSGAPALPELCHALAEETRRWLKVPALGLCYDDTRDLKPPPEFYAAWLQELRRSGASESLAFALGYGSESALDNQGKVKPTALHFTVGQQQFLASVREIAEEVTEEDFAEALLGPWTYTRTVKSLSWDATVSRDYALRASDPSRETRAGTPGADWLAFQALPLFPVVALYGSAQTACCGGRWKSGRFRWPLWGPRAGLGAVRSLLVHPRLENLRRPEREALGLLVVLASDIRRSDQGGYGSFGPARVATRDDRVGS
jgi:hypothetical protein